MQIFRMQIFVQALGVALTLVLSLSVIERYGLMGAAWTQLAVNALLTIVQLVISIVILHQTLREKPLNAS